MKILKSWVTGRPNGHGYLASVTMDVEFHGGFLFQFRGMRLIETKEKKVVLVMPNIKDSKGAWQTVFSPLNQNTRDILEGVAIDTWKKQWPTDLRDFLEPL